MKSLTERAKEFVDSLPLACAAHRKAIEERFMWVIKDQDKITRHACAEAILEMEDCKDGTGKKIFNAIDKDEAHSTCINVSVLENATRITDFIKSVNQFIRPLELVQLDNRPSVTFQLELPPNPFAVKDQVVPTDEFISFIEKKVLEFFDKVPKFNNICTTFYIPGETNETYRKPGGLVQS